MDKMTKRVISLLLSAILVCSIVFSNSVLAADADMDEVEIEKEKIFDKEVSDETIIIENSSDLAGIDGEDIKCDTEDEPDLDVDEINEGENDTNIESGDVECEIVDEEDYEEISDGERESIPALKDSEAAGDIEAEIIIEEIVPEDVDEDNGIMLLDETDFSDWIELTNGGELTSGNYYLSGDLKPDNYTVTTIPKNKNVVIDLNGYTFTATGTTYISVQGSLTLVDSSIEQTGMITGRSSQGLIYIADTGSFIMNGGIICSNSSGNGVYTKGTFTMNSGEIYGNKPGGYGGGVYIDRGTFNMYGGEIHDNSASYYGGGVYNAGYFNMYSGKIYKNEVNSSGHDDSFGGGVYNADYIINIATFTMSGGEISENVADYGGGIAGYRSQSKITGGEISGNIADYGGGIYSEGGSITLSNVKIIKNNASWSGGGIFLKDSSVGSVSATMTDCEISENTSERRGGGINIYSLDATVTMNGGKINDNTVNYQGYDGGGVYNCGTFTMTGGEINGNTSYLGGGVGNDGTFNMNNGKINNNISNDEAGGVYNTSTFNMVSGEINDNISNDDVGGVYNTGTFNMTSGEINGNISDNRGGGVYNGGTFNMTSGEINGNTAKYGGAGVYLISGTFAMAGGEIRKNENTSEKNGINAGGIYKSSKSTIYLSGFSIVNENISREGNPSNIFLDFSNEQKEADYLHLNDNLIEGASIGVTTSITPTSDNPVEITFTENETNYYKSSEDYFFSDEGYLVRANNENKYIEMYYDGPTVTYDANGATGEVPEDSGGYTEGDTITILGAEDLSIDGYHFTEWNTSADGTGTKYKAGETLEITETIILYAQWEAHSYTSENVTFDWANDFGCTVEAECDVCGEQTEFDCEVNSESISNPTCTETGKIKYTATVTIGEQTYAGSTEEIIAALGHAFGNVEWGNWVEGNDGWTVSASRTCSVCNEVGILDATVTSETIDPTCEEAGSVIYTASVTVDGEVYINESQQEASIDALGHNYSSERVSFSWSDTEDADSLTCEATFSCADCDYSETVSCEISLDESSITATCTEEGEADYIASAIIASRDCNVSASAVKTLPYAALGHDWVETTEVVDETTTKVTLTCNRCKETIVDVIVIKAVSESGISFQTDTNWSALLTEEQLEMLDDDAKVDFVLSIEDANETVSDTDVALVEAVADSLEDVESVSIYYMEIDLSMHFIVNGEDVESSLYETPQEIKITITIPAEIANNGADEYDYYIVRIYDGVAELIPVEYNADGTLTFSTDKLSTYAILRVVKEIERFETDISDCNIKLSETDYTYNGNARKPSVTVKNDSATLVEGTDYTVSYSNNTNAGTATVTITGIGNYSGTATKNFTINKADLSGFTITLGTTDYTYDGGAKKPSVTVKNGSATLVEGTDYTISYSNNTNAGTATVTITGIGNYSGTATKNFTINKASQNVTAKAATSSIEVGRTTTIAASGKGTITYSSENTSVATVNSNGVVTGKAAGSVTITMKAAGNSNYKSGNTTVKITVTLKQGSSYTSGDFVYKILTLPTTGTGTVRVTGPVSSAIKTAAIPAKVKIGGRSFKVTEIGAKAFKGCKKLTTVSTGKNVTVIGNQAFQGCTNMTGVSIQVSTTTIGKKVFYNCQKLKKIVIKSKQLTSVGKNTFKGIKANAKIKVPASKLKAYTKLLKNKGQGPKVKITS